MIEDVPVRTVLTQIAYAWHFFIGAIHGSLVAAVAALLVFGRLGVTVWLLRQIAGPGQ